MWISILITAFVGLVSVLVTGYFALQANSALRDIRRNTDTLGHEVGNLHEITYRITERAIDRLAEAASSKTTGVAEIAQMLAQAGLRMSTTGSPQHEPSEE